MDQKYRVQLRKLAKQSCEVTENYQCHLETGDEIIGPVFLMAIAILAKSFSSKPNNYDSQLRTKYKKYEITLSNAFPQSHAKFSRYWDILSQTNNFERFIQDVSSFLSSFENTDPYLLSWFYQYLKSKKEKEVMSEAHENGSKIAGEGICYATQFFTEPYMVRYLVKQCLEPLITNDFSIKDLCITDPACGGGNFLIEAMDFIFNNYKGPLNEKKLIETCLNSTLWGYDLDSNLSQIAALNLFLHAVNLCGATPKGPLNVFGGNLGDEIGFLDPRNTKEITDALGKAKTSVILTNPPFLGRRLMSIPLKTYLANAYPSSQSDLCVAFMIRCLSLLKHSDYAGFVNQSAWMHLSSFKKARKSFVNDYYIEECVELGQGAFLDLNGEKANVALTVFHPCSKSNGHINFIRLVHFNHKDKQEVLNSKSKRKNFTYQIQRSKFFDGENLSLTYNMNDSLEKKYNHFPRYSEFANPMQGSSTGNNDKYIRYSWQIPESNNDWKSVSKGGGYCKWAGLNWFKVLWGSNGELVRLNPGSALRNLDKIKRTQLVYSDTGTLGLNVRLLEDDQIFIASGPGIEIIKGDPFSHMAYLNSRTASFFMRMLSPKLTISAGYIKQLPFPESLKNDKKLVKLAKECVLLKSNYLSFKLPNDQFDNNILFSTDNIECTLEKLISKDIQNESNRLCLEYEIEKHVEIAFDFNTKDKDKIASEVGVCAAAFPCKKIPIKFDALEKEFLSYLGLSCRCKKQRNSRNQVGIEGIVEAFSQTYKISSNSFEDVLIKLLPKMISVKSRYLEDLLHKNVLSLLGLKSTRRWKPKSLKLKTITSRLCDLLGTENLEIITDCYGIKSIPYWLENRLLKTHNIVFRKKPILYIEDGSVNLKRENVF